MVEAVPFAKLLDVLDIRDVEGRALGEHRASAAVRDAMPMALKQCPYADRRHQHEKPMNVSALKQLTTHWDDILGGVAFVRAQYLARRGLSAVKLTREGLEIGEAIAAIPSYLVHRAQNPIADGALSPVVAGLYKVIIGINRVFAVVVSGQLGAGKPGRMSSPDDTVAFADLGGLLIGSQQVCAGSTRQIAQTVDMLINGTPASGSSIVESMLVPLDHFFAFADGMRRLEAAKFLITAAGAIALLRSGPEADELATELDPHGTIRNFAATRAPDQIERMLAGWFELAGGTNLPKLVAGRDPLHLLIHVEHHLAAVVAETERQLETALGRDAPTSVLDARAMSRALGVTTFDRVERELGVQLGSLGSPS
jgi:hypothetical protein